MAQAMVEQYRLDRLWVVPTGNAWHKATRLGPAHHRLAMTRLAFSGLSGVVVDDRELQRQGPSYTIDTLTALVAEQPPARWFVLMGRDQWLRFPTWHRWQDIARLATLVVADREDQQSAEGIFDAKKPDLQPAAAGVRSEPLHWQTMALSSSAVRQHLRPPPDGGAATQAMVPAAVASYISQHHLYSDHS
jgi:nicotinate-nucleotide adenylyltransferase